MTRSRSKTALGAWLWALGAAVYCQAPSVQSQAPSLTLQEAISRALARQPAVTAAQQRVRQAQFRLTAARAFPSTIIDIGHGEKLSDPGASGADQDLLITQRFDLFGQRGLRSAQARRGLEAARAELAQARADVTFRVHSTYTAAVAAVAEETLARQTVAVAETFQRLAEAQFRAGAVPVANVLRSQIEVENAGQLVLAAETNLKTQRAALNAALAQPLDTPLTLLAITGVTLHTYDLAALQRLSLQRPGLRSAEATLAARRAAVAVARAARRPDFILQGAHDQIQNWPGGNVIRAGFVLPLFDAGQIRAAVGEARAAAAEQEANVETLRQQAAVDVATAYYNLEQTRQLVERTGGAQMQRATRLYQLAELGYREGQTSYLDLLDASQVRRTALTSYLRALAGYDAAEAALERALGAPLPPPLSSTPARYEPPVIPLPPPRG